MSNPRRGGVPVSSALADVRVVDLSSGVAGSMATMLLADFGADVVKIEPPGGDPARVLPGFAVWNRNKRSVVLDQGHAEDRHHMAEFLAGADVCVISQPRAVLAGTQLDIDTLCATYPGLIVVH